MTLELYYTPSDNEEVSKTLEHIITLSDVHPVDVQSIDEPVLSIGSIDYDVLSRCNYARIPEYNRFYYLGVPSVGSNKRYYLPFREDYLMTFKRSFLSLPAIIDKEETDNNLYINDGTFIHGVKDYTRVYNYSVGFNDTPDNILICAGGE